jgi:uncharacterized protein
VSATALYEGCVRHRRIGPPDHAFATPATMVMFDLGDLEEVVAATPLWSTGPWAPVQFRRRDYLDGTDRPLAQTLADLVEARTGRRPDGPMRMLTQLRRLGWLFNPLTVYWCDPDVVVLEVSNTPWHERHWYVLQPGADPGPGDLADGQTFPKRFHVSPFLPMDLTYRLAVDAPPGAPRLDLRLTAWRQGTEVFGAHLDLDRIELTPTHALASLARRPLSTVAVSAGIHRQAAVLAAKRVPFHHHPERAR